MYKQLDPGFAGNLRIYKKILSDCLRERRFDSIADLVEEVKGRCARLRLPYASGQITDAINSMGNRIDEAIASPPSRHDEWQPKPDERPLNPQEALAALRHVLEKNPHVKAGLRTMPKVRMITRHEAAQRAALSVVAQAMVDVTAQHDDIERTVPKTKESNVNQTLQQIAEWRANGERE